MSDYEDDAALISDYLPELGHPQNVDEAKCPYCALKRIEARAERAEAMLDWIGERLEQILSWDALGPPVMAIMSNDARDLRDALMEVQRHTGGE